MQVEAKLTQIYILTSYILVFWEMPCGVMELVGIPMYDAVSIFGIEEALLYDVPTLGTDDKPLRLVVVPTLGTEDLL